MEKYDGMNKVEAQVQSVDRQKTVKPKKHSAAKLFCLQLAVAAVLGAVLFSGKVVEIPYYDKVTSAVKQVVEFDLGDYVYGQVKGD